MKNKVGKNLMRVIAALCIVAMLPLTAMAASATVTVTTAGSGAAAFTETAANAPEIAAGAQIQVAGTHSVPGAEVTFLVAPEGATSPIQGIGQRTSASAAGAFEINILLPADIAAGTYYVKVGGQDVDSPVVRYFKIASQTPPVQQEALLVSITGPGSVTSTGAYNGEISGSHTGDYEIGSQFTLTAVETDNSKFIHWVDTRSGRIVSTEPAYTFSLGTDTSLVAAFRAVDESGYIIFKEKNNKVVVTQSAAGDVTVPDDPYTMGYEFDSWVNPNGVPQKFAAGDVISANTFTNDIIFTAHHTVAGEMYQVNLVNVDGMTSGTYKYDTKLTVKPAAAPQGQKFAYWQKDGQIISYEQSYTFYVGAYTTTVEAVYVPETQEVTPAPIIVMSEPTIVQTNKIAFFAERTLPSNYTLIETGILLSSEIGTEITVDNAAYKSVSTSKDGNGQYTIRKSGVTPGETWAGRAYMIYRSGDEIVTVYSNTVTKAFL